MPIKKWIPLLLLTASIFFASFTSADGTIPLQAAALYSFAQEISDKPPELKLEMSAPYLKYRNKDEFMQLASYLSEILGPAGSFSLDANSALTYTAEDDNQEIAPCACRFGFKLYGSSKNQSYLVISISASTKPDVQSIEALLAFQEKVNVRLQAASLQPFWTTTITSSLPPSKLSAGQMHRQITKKMKQRFDLKQIGYYEDTGTVSRSFSEIKGNQHLQLNIHRHSQLHSKTLVWKVYS